ncbi:lytic murein transglycosylase [Corynebacterium hindlerae]|uniref:Lytic murein transglycosylase n=1 Tax=Corynebacterium hindlerae TaxID=699041 RepID=A0A7G5FGH8_9CORY|nr:lytic murein transglycosylase [Corynebacterium hindlerae]QMV85719.1 lytic murein transglycosylase [Corynebacterium hindlerae]
MGSVAKKAFGCGVIVVLAVVLVISMVGWVLSALHTPNPLRPRIAVPDDVPPAGAVEVPHIDVNAPGRTSEKLAFWAEPLSKQIDVSPAAIQAYGNAELIAQQSWPDCHLRWNTLAGIAQVETRHGTYTGKLFEGASIGPDGVVSPPIFGIKLDGSPGFANIPDTDGGLIDGDTEHDRAVGPFQFIPESWKRYGRDANGDGFNDPHQIDDAALSAANLLCTNGGDLSTPEGWAKAVYAYNQSDKYLADVRDAAAAYAVNQPAY